MSGGRLALLVLAACAPVTAGEDHRPDLRSDWVASDGIHVVLGAGPALTIVSVTDPAASPGSIALPAAPTAGVLVDGLALVAIGAPPALYAVDLEAGAASLLDPGFTLHGRVQLALAQGALVVAEDRVGLHLLALHLAHGDHSARCARRLELERAAFVPLPWSFATLAILEQRCVAVSETGAVQVVDLHALGAPRLAGTLAIPAGTRALTVAGKVLHAYAAGRLQILEQGGAWRTTSLAPGPLERPALAAAGRVVHLVARELDLVSFRDAAPLARTYTVSVNNNFFAPARLAVDVGDTVEWSNVTGIEHNVRSCTPDQLGCDGTAASESFTSGPESGFWTYQHVFTTPGSNPYVCLPHVPFMTGGVDVRGTAGTPPGVPDGQQGAPLRAAKLDATGSTLSLSWDASACSGFAGHHLLHGYGSGLPTTAGEPFTLDGARCGLGLAPPYVWRDAPDPALDPSRLVWWLVVADDDAATEGSWGRDSAGAERQSPEPGGASGRCGMTVKSLTNTCGQ